MSKTYRPYEPDQILLLPPSVKDWLPAGHLAHFISERSHMVQSVDLGRREDSDMTNLEMICYTVLYIHTDEGTPKNAGASLSPRSSSAGFIA